MQTGTSAFRDTFDYFTGYILTIIHEYLWLTASVGKLEANTEGLYVFWLG
jgi:hypothetical protein